MDYKQWRIDKGLTQEQAGKLIGTSRDVWSKLERGKFVLERNRAAANALLKAAEPDAEVPQPEVQAIEPVSPIDFNNMQVRTHELDGEIWFRLGDVCRTIDYANPANALRMIEEDDIQKLETIDAIGRSQETWFISEPGLYQFLAASNMPKARPFKRWVSKTVLPSIRKTGNYSTQQHNALPETQDEKLARLMGLRSEQATAEANAYTDKRLAEVKDAVAAAPSQAADEVLARMQALEAHKARLHDVVHSIVAKAKTLDQDDAEAQYYAQYVNVWRAVHRYANPSVSKLAGYTTPDQIQHAILGGESLLARLGGPLAKPQSAQLSLSLGEVVA